MNYKDENSVKYQGFLRIYRIYCLGAATDYSLIG
jgi:hypothetical protein